MHSAAGIEDRLFTPARIRLTAWYVSVLAAVLIVLGTTLYLVVREQLLNGVDNGVKLVEAKATEQWITTGNVNDDRTKHGAVHGQLPADTSRDDTRSAARANRGWCRAPGHGLDEGCLHATAATCAHPARRAIASVSTRCG